MTNVLEKHKFDIVGVVETNKCNDDHPVHEMHHNYTNGLVKTGLKIDAVELAFSTMRNLSP